VRLSDAGIVSMHSIETMPASASPCHLVKYIVFYSSLVTPPLAIISHPTHITQRRFSCP